jgi:hypothetical protein
MGSNGFNGNDMSDGDEDDDDEDLRVENDRPLKRVRIE